MSGRKMIHGWRMYTKENRENRAIENEKKQLWNKVNVWLKEFDDQDSSIFNK